MLNQNEKLAIKRVLEIYPEHTIVFEDNSEDNDCSFSEFFKSDYILIEVSDNYSQIRMLRKDRRPCPACVCHYIDQLKATEKLKMESEFIKKSLEIIDRLDNLPNDLYEYADEQSGYLNDEMFYQAKDLSEKIQQFIFELRAYMIDRIKDRKKWNLLEI